MGFNRTISKWTVAAFAGVCLLINSGCQSPTPDLHFSELPSKNPAKPAVITLQEGDSVRITFPGAPSLNTLQTIRRDGRITLPILGEFKASGLTPPEMENELVKLYGDQLQNKEVSVSVEASAFVVYVTGAVLRPGRVQTDRPINILSAVMEAGGFDQNRANLKAVRVIRVEAGKTQHYTLNLKQVLAGEQQKPFALQPGDIVFVPEKFSWF